MAGVAQTLVNSTLAGCGPSGQLPPIARPRIPSRFNQNDHRGTARHRSCENPWRRYRLVAPWGWGCMSMDRLTGSQIRLLEAGRFRFDGFSHAADVMNAQALIHAGYVTARDVGGEGYTCIECSISDEGRRILGQAARMTSEIALPQTRQLMI